MAAAATNVWNKRASMRTPRSTLAAAFASGKLYAIGGTGAGGKVLATVEAYTPGGNSWATRKPLPSARYAPSAGVINGVLYVAGGGDSARAPTKTLFAYTPGTNTWTTKAPMPAFATCGVSGVIGGKLYVRPPWEEPEAPLSWALLYRDDDVLGVAKPAGLPTLPGGGYLENTLWSLLRRCHPEAAPVHRLDRVDDRQVVRVGCALEAVGLPDGQLLGLVDLLPPRHA